MALLGECEEILPERVCGAVSEGERHILRVNSIIEWPGSPSRIEFRQSQREKCPHIPPTRSLIWYHVNSRPAHMYLPQCSVKLMGVWLWAEPAEVMSQNHASFSKLCLLGGNHSWLKTCVCPSLFLHQSYPIVCTASSSCLSPFFLLWFYVWR